MANVCNNELVIYMRGKISDVVPDYDQQVNYDTEDLAVPFKAYSYVGGLMIEPPFGGQFQINSSFGSRWGPDEEWLEKLYEHCKAIDPECTIECSYYEPGEWFCGVWRNGIDESYQTPNSAYSNLTDSIVVSDDEIVPNSILQFEDVIHVYDFMEEFGKISEDDPLDLDLLVDCESILEFVEVSEEQEARLRAYIAKHSTDG